MTREIKFRAWDRLNGKMYRRVETIDFTDGVDMRDEKGKGCFRMFENVELMQYIGINDINGKEIYEGDIVELGTENSTDAWIVCFYDGSFGFERLGHFITFGYVNHGSDGIRVVGNIYENPDKLPIQPKK